MGNMELVMMIGEAKINLDKAKVVSDLLWNEYFISETPDMFKIKVEFHSLATFEAVLGDYLFEMEKQLAEAEALAQKLARAESKKEVSA